MILQDEGPQGQRERHPLDLEERQDPRRTRVADAFGLLEARRFSGAWILKFGAL